MQRFDRRFQTLCGLLVVALLWPAGPSCADGLPATLLRQGLSVSPAGSALTHPIKSKMTSKGAHRPDQPNLAVNEQNDEDNDDSFKIVGPAFNRLESTVFPQRTDLRGAADVAERGISRNPTATIRLRC